MNVMLIRSPVPALLHQPLVGQDRAHRRCNYRNRARAVPRTSRPDDEAATTGCLSKALITDFGVRVRPGQLKSP